MENSSVRKLNIGVDVGGTKILTGLVDENGRVLLKEKTPMDPSDMESTVRSVLDALDAFVRKIGGRYEYSAVGFGLVGACDVRNSVWVRASNLPITKPVELGRIVSERYGVPGFVDNDVFSATIAENSFGAGKTYDDFILINVGTGLSAGIVADGRILRGACNVAGEIGRTTLGLADWSEGMLEDICSGGGILRRAAGSPYPSTKEIFENRDQDAAASRLIGDAAAALGEASAALVTIFNPSAVILAGSIGTIPFLAGYLENCIRERAFAPAAAALKEVRPSGLEEGAAGLIGAAEHARQGLYKMTGKDVCRR